MLKNYRKFRGYLFIVFTALFFISCGSDKKNGQSNVASNPDEETVFARSVLGGGAVVLMRGDFTGRGMSEALVGHLNKKINDNTFWLQRAAIIDKRGINWFVLLGFAKHIGSDQKMLLDQIDAAFGYIIEVDNTTKPARFNVFISNQNGNPASDEIAIVWDAQKKEYFVEGNREPAQ